MLHLEINDTSIFMWQNYLVAHLWHSLKTTPTPHKYTFGLTSTCIRSLMWYLAITLPVGTAFFPACITCETTSHSYVHNYSATTPIYMHTLVSNTHMYVTYAPLDILGSL